MFLKIERFRNYNIIEKLFYSCSTYLLDCDASCISILSLSLLPLVTLPPPPPPPPLFNTADSMDWREVPELLAADSEDSLLLLLLLLCLLFLLWRCCGGGSGGGAA